MKPLSEKQTSKPKANSTMPNESHVPQKTIKLKKEKNKKKETKVMVRISPQGLLKPATA